MPVEYKHGGTKFFCKGMSISSPPDRIAPGKFPYLQNVRAYHDGRLGPRPGLSLFDSALPGDTYVHTLQELNDPLPGASPASTIIGGVGKKLYNFTGSGGTDIDSGYSGYPLSRVPWRPAAAPDSWLYLSDGTRSRKVKVDGTNYAVGIAPPNSAPGAELGVPNLEVLSETNTTTGWVAAGTAATLTTSSRLSTTIAGILYDSGSTGWASLTLADTYVYEGIGKGTIIQIGAGFYPIHDVINLTGNSGSITISGISYDSGTSGLCTIQPSVPIYNLAPNALVTLSGTETVRVVSVQVSPGGVQTFRCSTSSTHASGDTIGMLLAYRIYSSATHASGDAVSAAYVQVDVSSGVGTLTYDGAMNLGEINGRLVLDSDRFRIGIAVGVADDIQSLSLQFALADNTFGNDYLHYDLTAVDLAAANTGQFIQIEFPVSDLIRVGSQAQYGLANVVAIRLEVTASVPASGSVPVAISGWWLGGTYGPDVSGADQPYTYVQTFYSKATGAESNPGPVTRAGLLPENDEIVLTGVTSSDAQVDTCRFYRLGGTLTTWQLVGEAGNTGTPTLTDTLSDADILQNPALNEDNFQPFPVQDTPKSGTINVAGTRVTWVSGQNFDVRWLPGSYIAIGGTVYTLYGSPTSTTELELVESAGFQTGVAYTIQEPTLAAQPLPSIWGPYQGTMFACGDQYNPGYLYWCQPNNPDAAGAATWIEVTSPTEPLIAGCMYDGRCYVFSNKRMFIVTPSLQLASNGSITFQAQDIPSSRGLFMRTGLAVGDMIYFVGPDGIYATFGYEPQSITAQDMRSLFPFEGIEGSDVVLGTGDTVKAPQLNSNPLKAQLVFYNGILYFDYPTGSTWSTLVFDTNLQAWFKDAYADPATVHSGKEGGSVYGLLVGSNTGVVYTTQTTPADQATNVPCVAVTPAWDEGDPRVQKFYADAGMNIDSGGVAGCVTVEPWFDTLTSHEGGDATLGAATAGVQYSTFDFAAGQGEIARNVGFRISWAQAVQVSVYDLTFGWLPQPDVALARAEYTNTIGVPGAKWVQGIELEADTFGAAKQLTVYADGVSAATFDIIHSGQQNKPYSWEPFIANEVRIIGDSAPWRLFNVAWRFDVLPPLTTTWKAEPTGFGIDGWKLGRWVYVRLISNATVTLTVTIDGTDYAYSIASTELADKSVYIPLVAAKGKLYQFSATSTLGFRLFQPDLQVMIKPMNGGQWATLKPFGGPSNRAGAVI